METPKYEEKSLKVKEKKILLIHTNLSILNFFKKNLQRNNFLVHTYFDPILALENYKPFFYDLLLLEVRMVAMTGFEFYSNILKIEKIPACFITPLSAYYDILKEIYPNINAKCFLKEKITEEELIKYLKIKLNIDLI